MMGFVRTSMVGLVAAIASHAALSAKAQSPLLPIADLTQTSSAAIDADLKSNPGSVLNAGNYLKFYLQDSSEFNPDIPAPHEILGVIPGEIHLTPEAIQNYIERAVASSERASMRLVGTTHEKRPLSNIYISSPQNLARLEQLREAHLNAGSAQDDSVLVVKLAYSIHGNEPSGANAVPLIVYYMLSSNDPWITSLLERTVVIIEPMQNPDGLARFTQWVNAHRTNVPNYDPAQRNHHASWPSGRTNHYMFDLNRDWIFETQPESQARIREYYNWRPHVLGDYHEMGGDKPSYFFQPGHPLRTHPLTLAENQAITAELARFHAGALDRVGQSYYTQERFDDFYYGKGSAYPDITGGIGLLFEQTAARGMVRDFNGERLTFRQTVANQVATSLSLLRGADALRNNLIDYRFEFSRSEAQRSQASPIKGYLISDGGDPQRALALRNTLASHGIEIFEIARSITVSGKTFRPGSSWVVPTSPGQFGIVKSLFETRTEFDDNVFYDISTWNLPLAFDLPYAPTKSLSGLIGARARNDPIVATAPASERGVGLAIPWNQMAAPRLLQALLDRGLHPRMAGKAFVAELAQGGQRAYDAGTLVVLTNSDAVRDAVSQAISVAPSVHMDTLASGLTPRGPDLGSNDMHVLKPVSVAMIVGDGADIEEAGEIWHLFDKDLGAPLSLLDMDRVESTDLGRYTHIVFPGGSFGALARSKKVLRDWVEHGGIVVAQKGAANWVFRNIYCDPSSEKESKSNGVNGDGQFGCERKDQDKQSDKVEFRDYGDFERDQGDKTISGAILNTRLDLTHPFAFGYSREILPMFKTSNQTIEPSENPFGTPVRYLESPLASGFVGEDKQQEIGGSPAVALHRLGKGYVIALADDLNFRGVWAGTRPLYINTIYFTQTIKNRDLDD